jgi:hypothetical protein
MCAFILLYLSCYENVLSLIKILGVIGEPMKGRAEYQNHEIFPRIWTKVKEDYLAGILGAHYFALHRDPLPIIFGSFIPLDDLSRVRNAINGEKTRCRQHKSPFTHLTPPLSHPELKSCFKNHLH